MNNPRFIQIHFLTSYPASLINRDDVGFAKRIPFGGAVRTRISSQCLKRHWRRDQNEYSLSSLVDDNMSVRSRRTFDEHLYKPLLADGVAEPLARAVTSELMTVVLGMSAGREKRAAKEDPAKPVEVASAQVTVFGKPELRFLLEQARAICKETSDSKKVKEAVKKHLDRDRAENLRTLKLNAGLDAALFGRMVTGDIFARCDAAIHVAHAFTVHGEAAESDYFSAVDDLLSDGDSAELGSGHINTAELTTGLFYGYVVVDIPLLTSNLGDDRTLAAKVADHLVHLVATVTPAAKIGSTAAHSYADFILVEAGKSQPRTLANAFLRPVRPESDLLASTYHMLGDHLGNLDRAYGRTDRKFLAVDRADSLGESLPDAERASSLNELAQWAAARIGG
ncbi:MAG: type I-E CRISPR-associated protein Cas7/Cse4/CasC [Candidatus Binatus sp.]|uniref:type I-E CRISPR-associated protein Cas7/Cse4/CasC n=1 Tax=Candidatus Binatus sp. TaxID=2811406 RepID=UPI002728694B|nr:type I-E CRISPR-associated protein Cas7/Cse4/CasC [Candidatus Binatus sp.]MDO8434693.1 type I-E CRISPR-associated protein Cas7/Cse4/CasC [Candidatus Binatus sp.]